MAPLTGKRVFSIMALCMMVGLLLLPIVIALPSPAIGEEAPAGDTAKKDGDKVEKGRDVYYKTEGIVVGDRKSTRLNSSHPSISYAVFCLKKQKRGRHQ